MKLSISTGNAKLGVIPSVSLPCGVTCNPAAPCFKKCYAGRLAAFRPSVRNAYAANLDLLSTDPRSYWLQVRAAAVTVRFFRYHVSGDVPDVAYLSEMVRAAQDLPGTRFLAFTKQYELVNAFLSEGGHFPANLQIILSNWGTWKCDNPHGLPVSEVIFKGETPSDAWKVCGGSCTDCACRGVGCWELKPGETIAFYEH